MMALEWFPGRCLQLHWRTEDTGSTRRNFVGQRQGREQQGKVPEATELCGANSGARGAPRQDGAGVGYREAADGQKKTRESTRQFLGHLLPRTHHQNSQEANHSEQLAPLAQGVDCGTLVTVGGVTRWRSGQLAHMHFCDLTHSESLCV
jgi:hypothetical protein